MREVHLSRSESDRRRYQIEGIGWLRGTGAFWIKSEAGAGAHGGWRFEPRGWMGGRAEALDALSGLPVGEYRRTAKLSQDGSVVWHSRTYELRATSKWRSHYALFLDNEPLVELEVKSFGKQPVLLRLAPDIESEPGLVLFVCWLAQRFTAQSAGAA